MYTNKFVRAFIHPLELLFLFFATIKQSSNKIFIFYNTIGSRTTFSYFKSLRYSNFYKQSQYSNRNLYLFIGILLSIILLKILTKFLSIFYLTQYICFMETVLRNCSLELLLTETVSTVQKFFCFQSLSFNENFCLCSKHFFLSSEFFR